jgi:hypothetical protein
MPDSTVPPPPPRHTPARGTTLPPYAYVPGHGLPHPVNDPGGHLHATRAAPHAPHLSPDLLAALDAEPVSGGRALAEALTADPHWLVAIDLFNAGFSWEAHEAWEAFWLALGRVGPAARFIQGLIHLAAAGVKIREGKPAGVGSHTRRARELLGEPVGGPVGTLGIAPESIAAVLAELEAYRPACWHTARCPVVRVLAAELRLAG